MSDEKVLAGSVPLLNQSKSVFPTAIAPGGQVEYTIVIDNIGSGPSGSPVVITEFLPDYFEYDDLVSVTVNGASFTGSTTVDATDLAQPVFSVPSSINDGQSLVLVFTAYADPGIPVDSNPATAEVDPYCNSYKS